MADMILAGQFIETATKAGMEGLTPTVDVERILLVSPFTRTAHLTGGSATAVGRRGLYFYGLTGVDPTTYAYLGTFITTSSSVDQVEVAALAQIIPDAAVSSRAAPADVDASLATYDAPTKAELDAGLAALNDITAGEVRTELATELARIDVATSTRATPADVDTSLATYDGPTKAELTAALAGLNDPSTAEIAAEIAAALAGTVSLTITSAVSGDQITVYSRDAWAFTVSSDSLSLDTYTDLAFVAKASPSTEDSAGLLYVRTDTGLETIGGSAAADPAAGSLTNTATSFTISIDADQTALDPTRIRWWLKGLAPTPTTVATGVFVLSAGGVHAIT